MRKVIVSLDKRSYPSLIGSGLLVQAGSHIKSLVPGGRAIIISDAMVFKLFGATLTSSLIKEGIKVHNIQVPPSENSKSLNVATNIYLELAKNNIDRSDFIVALGGGVVGDLAGFVAATYLRGLSFVQVPTTLLSQIDSSIGGKTGINLNNWKNLIGVFYQPKVVIIDVDLIEGLPDVEKSNGFAEIIKTAFISGEYLVAFLEGRQDNLLDMDRTSMTLLIEECCRFKANIVAEDETEDDLRKILNYGHTMGHAIESVVSPRWTHGQAVAVGMIFGSLVAYYLEIVKGDMVARHINLIKKAGLPTSLPNLNQDDLFAALYQDKKRSRGKLNFVIVKSPGNARIIEIDQRIISTVLDNFKELSKKAMRE